MFGKLSIALLIAASPALAEEAATTADAVPAEAEASEAVAYKTKRVCRSIEVVGSSIPRTTCTTKRVPIKPAKPAPAAESAEEPVSGQ